MWDVIVGWTQCPSLDYFVLESLNHVGTKFLEKERCFLQVYKQIKHIYFNPDTLYGPVASHSNLWMSISIATAQNDKVERGDVDNAYLYGDIDSDVYTCSSQLAPPEKKKSQNVFTSFKNQSLEHNNHEAYGDPS